MPAPKLIWTYAFFVRSDDSTTKPSFTAAHSLGTVTNVDYDVQDDEVVFEKPIDGRLRDVEVLAQRDRELVTLTISELTPEFWKILRGTNPTLSGGAASYVPGSTLITKGWLQVQQYDEDDQLLDVVDRFVRIKLRPQSFSTGLATATFECRKLHSALNGGAFSNIT